MSTNRYNKCTEVDKREDSLLELLKEWYTWATGGDSEYHFSPSSGLCNAAYLNSSYKTLIRLKKLFLESGMDICYPFGEDNYDDRCKNQTQHLCPIRLKWVRNTIKDLESE